MEADEITTELGKIRDRGQSARYPEDDGLYLFAAEVSVRLRQAGMHVRRAGCSVDVYPGSGVPEWRVWVERGVLGHLIADGEFGRSSRDLGRLLAAVDKVLKLAAEWTDGSYSSSSALDEDRAWVRAACGGKLREAVLAALTGRGEPDGR